MGTPTTGSSGTRRALLVGSETYGLSGCDADVALMHDVLSTRGFDQIEVRTGTDASRAGIIDGLERLVGSVAAGDAVVVYYSGHGGRVVRPDFEARKAAGLSVDYQFIVPHDLTASDDGDFRGILSEELTHYQRGLSDAFHAAGHVANVVTILDCCHAGYMARSAEARAKAIDLESTSSVAAKTFRMKGIREHADKLGAETQLGGRFTNPEVVRIVACQPEQSAYEFPSSRGGRHGALTDALATVLDGLGPAAVPWGVVGDLVRRRVRALQPEQRPDVEGPADRMLFSTDSAPSSGALAVTAVNGVATIEAAVLLGIDVGDEFEIIVPGQNGVAGTAVVERIDGGAAVLDVSNDAEAALLEGAAIAVPSRISVPKLLVDVGGLGTGGTAMCADLEASSRLLPTTESVGAMAGVGPGSTSGTLVVFDPTGAPWRTDEHPDDARGRREVVDVLQAIAVGHRLLDLASGAGAHSLDSVPTIEFGLAEAPGPRTPLPSHGARVPLGRHVYLRVQNTGDAPLFAWVFDVGVSGRSSLLTNAAPSGTPLGAAGTEEDTLDVWGPAGETLFWPDDVPPNADPHSASSSPGRLESFVVLLADQRADLSGLASPGGTARGAPASPLGAIIDEARIGRREVAAAGGTDALRYRLDTVDFFIGNASEE